MAEQKSTLEWHRDGDRAVVQLVGGGGAFSARGRDYHWSIRGGVLGVERLGASTAHASFSAALAILKRVRAGYAELVDLGQLEAAVVATGALRWSFVPDEPGALEEEIAVWHVEA